MTEICACSVVLCWLHTIAELFVFVAGSFGGYVLHLSHLNVCMCVCVCVCVCVYEREREREEIGFVLTI
jgi:hypothetical protein